MHRDRRRQRAGDPLADARPADQLRRLHAGRRAHLQLLDDGHRDLLGGRRDAVGRRPSTNNPGKLVNGAFALALPVEARSGAAAFAPVSGTPLTLKTYAGPISNDMATLDFQQRIGATDPLRTGTYSKTLTYTLSTTNRKPLKLRSRRC